MWHPGNLSVGMNELLSVAFAGLIHCFSKIKCQNSRFHKEYIIEAESIINVKIIKCI